MPFGSPLLFLLYPLEPRWPHRTSNSRYLKAAHISSTPLVSAVQGDIFHLPAPPAPHHPCEREQPLLSPRRAVPSSFPPRYTLRPLFFSPHLGFNEAHSTLPKTKGPSRFQTDLHDASVRHKRVSMATLTGPPSSGMPFSNSAAPQNPFVASLPAGRLLASW